MMTLGTREMDKLAWLWEFHRKNCQHQGDMKLEYRLGGGIGTATIAICACGQELDITDYFSW